MKKITVFFLCAAMILTMLSGCGSAVPAQTAETAETTLAAAEPVAETAAAEETVPAETQALEDMVNDFRIAVIAKDRFEQHWLDVVSGAMRAAEELGCEVADLSPVMRDDAQQAEQIRNAVLEGFDAIVVTAEDSDAVEAALQEAAAAEVKVICVDSHAAADASAVLRTDDRAAGKAAGEAMIAALKEKEITAGTIGIIGMDPDSQVSAQREGGFREALAGTAYTLLEVRYSGGDAAMAHAIAEDYIGQNAVGIFCYTEGCTVGAGNAVAQSGAGTVVVGFGENERIEAQVSEGWLSAVLVQDPDTMGYEGIKAACAVLHGKILADTVIDTGVSILTE